MAGVVALGLAASAPGCLFAPDCSDLLLPCDGEDGQGGDSSSSGTGDRGPTPCAIDADCKGSTTPTCDPVVKLCRDCAMEDCRAPLGAACTTHTACKSGLCANGGVCVACSTNEQCPSMLCEASACKAPTGAPCAQDSDCVIGECRFNLCRHNLSHACTLPEECFNGVCTDQTCQSCTSNADCPGTSCKNNRCLLPKGAGCWVNAEKYVGCFSGACVGFPATCQ